MGRRRDLLEELAELHKLRSRGAQRSVWRQGMAALARAVADQRFVPLEGLDPEALASTVRVALGTRLVEELDFLSPPAQAAALYELAAALPMGFERRELGRRVLERLHDGNAETFVAVATVLALGPRRALSGPSIQARVAIALDLPLGAGVNVDPLALALISRPDLEREWLSVPATGPLPARRLAARLLERAAREAARQALMGDDSGVTVFENASVKEGWKRLLRDRSSQVWCHVAVARGLLSAAVPRFAQEIVDHLDPSLGPTQWRRAAASVAARIAIDPERGLEQGRAVAEGVLARLDPKVASAMILGLPRAAEVEPEAAEALLDILVRIGGVDAAEALIEARRELAGPVFGERSAETALRRLERIRPSKDHGQLAIIEVLREELRLASTQDRLDLHEHLRSAVSAYAEEGAAAAHALASNALDAATSAVDSLEGVTTEGGELEAFRVLLDLDSCLLQRSTMSDLLTLIPSQHDTSTAALGALFGRLMDWILAREQETEGGGEEHVTVRLRRLQTLLHLVDADSTSVPGAQHRSRRLRTARVLLGRLKNGSSPTVRHALASAAARACDVLVREQICEVSDIVIAEAVHLVARGGRSSLAEASMLPEIEVAARAMARLAEVVEEAPQSSDGGRKCVDELFALAHGMPHATSRRVKAFRAALLSFARNLQAIAWANSLREVVEGAEANLLTELEGSATALAQLVTGARRRFDLSRTVSEPQVASAIRLVDFEVDRLLRGSTGSIPAAVSSCSAVMRDELPEPIADAAVRALRRLEELPADPDQADQAETASAYWDQPSLPPWMPPRRVLGGFKVLRALSSGLTSVFVARPLDVERMKGFHKLALKVPEYDGESARVLSEEQFLQRFRDDGACLESLPEHQNLAQYLWFDPDAQPKPILAMELVEGPSLERIIEMGDLTVYRALTLLDGIAAGLGAMHSVGIAHLDLKPANVILRDDKSAGAGPADGPPVLVDFGLSGRSLRPGCGAARYAAPEVWGAADSRASALKTDVYAFGCLAFEVLTGRPLFDGTTTSEISSAHMRHDGRPHRLVKLEEQEPIAGVTALLYRSLRSDPRNRASIDEIRAGLKDERASLVGLHWPL